MSGRIAHRPHYRTMRQFVQPPSPFYQDFFRKRWTYRRQSLIYERRPLGYGLSLIPVHYRLAQQLIVHQT